MPKIYDNIENHLTKGLNETLELSQRTDFCVGYFNLRGWKEVADKIDSLSGATVIEGKDDVHRICRLLVGMQKMPIDILRDYFSKDDDHIIDQAEAVKLKKRLAQEFKDQLTIGTPTEADEKALRKLSQQMKDKKVVVKLHLRYTLHAKLYLAYSNDKRVPVVGFLGSSNLTLAGLAKQGELNIDVMDQDAANKLATWFDDRWKDRWCIDITEELIEIIDNSWAADRLVSHDKLKKKSGNKRLIDFFRSQPTKHKLYYFRAVLYWVKILEDEPVFREDGVQTTTGEMKSVYVDNEDLKYTLISLLSSSLFFVHYITWSSCQVINSRDFELPFDFNSISSELKTEFVKLGKRLQKDLQENSVVQVRNYSARGRSFTMEKQYFYIKKSKAIIDEIDTVLAKHYGFTNEELDFIINYDIKYRMGKELENEDEE